MLEYMAIHALPSLWIYWGKSSKVFKFTIGLLLVSHPFQASTSQISHSSPNYATSKLCRNTKAKNLLGLWIYWGKSSLIFKFTTQLLLVSHPHTNRHLWHMKNRPEYKAIHALPSLWIYWGKSSLIFNFTSRLLLVSHPLQVSTSQIGHS